MKAMTRATLPRSLSTCCVSRETVIGLLGSRDTVSHLWGKYKRGAKKRPLNLVDGKGETQQQGCLLFACLVCRSPGAVPVVESAEVLVSAQNVAPPRRLRDHLHQQLVTFCTAKVDKSSRPDEPDDPGVIAALRTGWIYEASCRSTIGLRAPRESHDRTSCAHVCVRLFRCCERRV